MIKKLQIAFNPYMQYLGIPPKVMYKDQKSHNPKFVDD